VSLFRRQKKTEALSAKVPKELDAAIRKLEKDREASITDIANLFLTIGVRLEEWLEEHDEQLEPLRREHRLSDFELVLMLAARSVGVGKPPRPKE